ncbi:retrovirus-related pol polyprotein from transposon TNT 1-94 [Tanacetum coccineum]
MHSRFEMSLMREMKFFLGLQIHQSPRGIFINQAMYALEILKKHGMDKCDNVGTPMTTKPKLDADLSGKLVDQTDYRSKIRSLMHLTSSRPDIVHAICKGLPRYPKDPGFELTAFSNADHTGCIDTRKSTSGEIQFLGDKLVSWMSKKQDCTAMSSAEAEYVALSASCAQENNDNQAADTQFQHDEFINPFCTPVREITESSSCNINNLNMHTFYQPYDSEYRWTKDHSLEQVCGNPSKPVQSRRQLATDSKMCMFALTVSTTEPKNIKEAMDDSSWIEAMQEELH